MTYLDTLKVKLKNRKFKIFLGVILFYVFGGLVSGGDWLILYKPSYEGRIIDKATREPIEGAVVAVRYKSETYGGIQTMSGTEGVAEVTTDKDGKFRIAPSISLMWPLTVGNGSTFIVYKPGYKSIDGQNLERCFTVGSERQESTYSGIVVDGQNVELPKVYDLHERFSETPSFSYRPYDRANLELASTKMLVAEREFQDALNDIHGPFEKMFQDTRHLQKPKTYTADKKVDNISEAVLKELTNALLSDKPEEYRKAEHELLTAGFQATHSILDLLDAVEPGKRPRVTRLLGQIGDPVAVERLCEELQPEHNSDNIEEQQVVTIYAPILETDRPAPQITNRTGKKIEERQVSTRVNAPSLRTDNANSHPAPEVTYRTVKKKQTIEDVVLALRSFPGQKASNCLVQALPQEPYSKDYISTTLVGFGSLSTQSVVAALPEAAPLLKQKLLAILGGISDNLAFETLLAEGLKNQPSTDNTIKPISLDHSIQPLIQQLHAAMDMERGSRSKLRDAINTLVRSGPKAVGAVAELLHSDNYRTRILALWVISKIDDDTSRQILRGYLKDQSTDIATVALYGLGRIGNMKDLKTIVGLVKEVDHPGLIDAAKKSIKMMVYRYGRHLSEGA